MQITNQNSSQPSPIYSSNYKKAALALNGLTSLFKGGCYYLAGLPSKLILPPEKAKAYLDSGQAHLIDGISRLASLYFYHNCLLASSVNRGQLRIRIIKHVKELKSVLTTGTFASNQKPSFGITGLIYR